MNVHVGYLRVASADTPRHRADKPRGETPMYIFGPLFQMIYKNFRQPDKVIHMMQSCIFMSECKKWIKSLI